MDGVVEGPRYIISNGTVGVYGYQACIDYLVRQVLCDWHWACSGDRYHGLAIVAREVLYRWRRDVYR